LKANCTADFGPVGVDEMFLGLLIAAFFSATVLTVSFFVMGAPLWVVLITYPATGTLVLLLGPFAISLCGVVRGGKAEGSPHLPVQRNTTPTVANNTLTSVVNDNARS
jgi:hypothetical protein